MSCELRQSAAGCDKRECQSCDVRGSRQRLEVTALHNHFSETSRGSCSCTSAGTAPWRRKAAAVGKVFGAMRDAAGRPAGRGRSCQDLPRPLEGRRDPRRQGGDEGRSPPLHVRQDDTDAWRDGRRGHGGEHLGSLRRQRRPGGGGRKEDELQTVLKALRKGGIEVVAIHSHMPHEEPRIVFLHYWGTGPAARLARVLRSALEAQTATGRR
jgi:hypothetical protein